MCGIAGILKVHPPGAPPPPPEVAIPDRWLDILDDSIKHRGPDGAGRFRDRATRPDGSVVDIALIHRRLAIIDPACGHQPMVWPPSGMGFQPMTPPSPPGAGSPPERTRSVSDGPDLLAVTFNGCIYNHRDLRQQLESAGHRFETDHSDTEVLIHGYRQWGEHLFDRLDGMFSLAIWDARSASLVLARDRFGEKPLYWRNPRGLIAWSSALPGLTGLPFSEEGTGVGAQLKPLYRALWIKYGYSNGVPTPQDLVVPPATGLKCGQAPERFHSVPMGKGAPRFFRWKAAVHARSRRPDAEVLEERLAAAVRSRLEADVPLGCFLSGGVDSSLVTALAHRARPDIHAFTVRMPDYRFDESPHAAQVAKFIGVRHEVLDCHASPADDLQHLIRSLGLPFGDSSLLPTYWLCKSAVDRVRVALSGDGADELFGGYERYSAARIMGLLGPARLLARYAGRLLLPDGDPKSTATRRSRFLAAAGYVGYEDIQAIFPEPYLRELLVGGVSQPLWFQALNLGPRVIRMLCEPATELAFRSATASAIASDIACYLPDDILRKTDTASMAVALEVRAPFLARDLADMAQTTTIRRLMPRGQRKGLLRQVARKYLPPEIVDRPKQGFAIPISDWFRTDYGGMKTLLLDHLHSAEPWGPPSLGIDLNMNFVRQMETEHMESRRDHGQRLYMLLVLSIWAKWLSSLKP